VRLLGFVPDDDLPYAYRAADLTIVPTIALEGFGLIVAESFAAGTPCLVTSGTGSAAIAAGVTAALTGAVSMPTAAACLDFARRNYDWSVIAERTRLVYEEAVR
jgi:glycosyltransferase involved in cell wall biosynthesis